jgi:hypothetical protein
MKFSVSLLESDQQIRGLILDNLSQQISSSLQKSVNPLTQSMKAIITKALESQPEYQSLTSGQLRKEFGIANVNNVNIVINNLVNTLVVKVLPIKIINSGISGGISIEMIPSDTFGGALSDASAIVVDENKGYSLPWLEWLLLRGTDIIVRNYSVKLGPNPNSRSGDAIMVSSSNNWRVPPEFVGTQRNNWTTRAIESAEDEIINTIRSTVERNI